MIPYLSQWSGCSANVSAIQVHYGRSPKYQFIVSKDIQDIPDRAVHLQRQFLQDDGQETVWVKDDAV
jgi:hypothetical protein